MEQHKRVFTTKAFKGIVFDAVMGMKALQPAKKAGLISDALQNHIFLAVTEVNGCALCSYKHTRDALEMGMSEEELTMYLSGDLENAPEDEVVALTFAQHYAETRGDFSELAWQRVVDTYGEAKAQGVLGGIKAITLGNAYGLALGALWNRIEGKPVHNSRLSNELGVIVSLFLFLPVALVRSIFVE